LKGALVSSTIRGIDVSIYLVKDLERAVRFYRDTLGLSGYKKFSDEYAEFVLEDDAAFGLYRQEEWHPGNGVTFGVADIQTAIAEYTERGVGFKWGGQAFETPVCFIALAEDTEGNTFYLHQRKGNAHRSS
jgi:predicted enzyme related to lactoylglutathione lyase